MAQDRILSSERRGGKNLESTFHLLFFSYLSHTQGGPGHAAHDPTTAIVFSAPPLEFHCDSPCSAQPPLCRTSGFNWATQGAEGEAGHKARSQGR